MKKLVVIDGLNFLFRAYYAVRPLTRSDGLHTNALYGFTQMLLKVISDLKPDLCCVALDSTPTFRHDLFPDYKGHRKELDEEMKEQLPLLQPMIEAFGIPGLKVEGYEADDIIATLAVSHKKDYQVIILSSDKDLMQLLDDNVELYDTMKDKRMGPEGSMEKFGVPPEKVTWVQALIGDSSDNIPGVMGVGPKTAEKLISEYGDLDTLYDNVDKVKGKLKDKLIADKKMAYLSHQLVTLKTDVPLPKSDTELVFDPDGKGAVSFLEDMEFGRLKERAAKVLGVQGSTTPKVLDTQNVSNPIYVTLNTPELLDKWIAQILDKQLVCIDTETTSLEVINAQLVGISLAVRPGEAAYIPMAHMTDMLDTDSKQLDKAYVLSKLKPLLEDDTIVKVGQNIKYDSHILRHEGIELCNIEDTMLMSACLDSGLTNHGMDSLAKRHLNHECIPFKEVAGVGQKQVTFDYVPIDAATRYAAEDADITLRLYWLFKERLDHPDNAAVKSVYEKIEKPLITVLTDMEETGVLVDTTGLQALGDDFDTRLQVAEKTIYDLAGETFNINSPKQMGEVLFDKLELPSGKKRSTNASVLEKLAEDHPICAEILVYRGLAKLKSTYVDALIKQTNRRTGRVHTSYHQVGAATGRFSSSDPNLQNIPSRSDDGRQIRKHFVAPKGWKIICADYSQIELRLLAHLSGSKALQQAFSEGHDIHRFTAHQIFDTPFEKVNTEQRSAAKAINFGLVYGMGKFSLAKHIGVSHAEAQQYIDNYFTRYSGVRDFLETYKEFAKANGYIETMFGRRVHLPGMLSNQPMQQAAAARAAINAPLQGANADIIKMVMPGIHYAFKKEGYQTRMLMQVHDELVFEAPENEVEVVSAIIKDKMMHVVSLDVPLEVGLDVADNWEEAH